MASLISSNVDVYRKGEWIQWEWPEKHTVPQAVVLSALQANNLDSSVARVLPAPDAFIRAVRAVLQQRARDAKAVNPDQTIILRPIPVPDTSDEIAFQFTAEYATVNGLTYSPDATVRMDKKTGNVTATGTTDPVQFAADITAAIPQFQATRNRQDMNRLLNELYKREFNVLAVPQTKAGVTYFPDYPLNAVNPIDVMERVILFIRACGGWIILRAPVTETLPVSTAPTAPTAPTGTPTPTPLPSTPPTTQDMVADAYANAFLANLYRIYDDIEKYWEASRNGRSEGRLAHSARTIRDRVSAAMADIDVIGRSGSLGVWWERFYDYAAGLEHDLANDPNAPAASVPVTLSSVLAPSSPIVVTPPSVDMPLFPRDLLVVDHCHQLTPDTLCPWAI